MKWWPTDCEAGDIIRVHLGSVEHYGIFVSEDEVIQFGLPPVKSSQGQPSEFKVVATDIATFCCGNIPEVSVPDKKELKARFSKEETIARARARIGEEGYSMLHNNCEHFVYECAYGIKKSTQVDSVRKKWLASSLFSGKNK